VVNDGYRLILIFSTLYASFSIINVVHTE